MTAFSSALVSIFLMIALGALLRQVFFTNDEQWRLVDRINYFVLFPSLLVHTLAGAQLGTIDVLPVSFALTAGLATAVLCVTVIGRLMAVPGPQFASMFQGGVRWNGLVGIATVAGLGDPKAVATFAIAIAVLVPLLNIMSVVILTRTNGGGPAPYKALPGILARNPLILACLVGVLLNGQPLFLETVAGDTVDLLGQAALTMGLLGIGAGLDLSALKGRWSIIGVTTAFKLIVMPFVFAGWATTFGLSGMEYGVAVVCGAVPSATSSYVLARQLGSDAELMAALVTSTTLGALVTMPIMLWLLTSP